jgi:hypothetical protein
LSGIDRAWDREFGKRVTQKRSKSS